MLLRPHALVSATARCSQGASAASRAAADPRTSPLRAFSAAAARPARVAVVGCGGWTQGWHLPNLANRSDATVVALVDPSDQPGVGGCVPSRCESMSALSARYSAPRYASLDALLETGPPLDGVLIAAPHRFHFALGKAALEAGLHVLMEKPMTTDVAEARALHELAAARPQLCFALNNTANWQPGSRAAFAAAAELGEIRLVQALFAAPLGWLFEGSEHGEWTTRDGTMQGNGFGWGQFAHSFAWIYRATGLTPSSVYAVCRNSESTGADLFDSLVIRCTNGASISAAGVGNMPDHGHKVVSNWIFGSEGVLSYSGLAGSDNVEHGGDTATTQGNASGSRLQMWKGDGSHSTGPPVEFESLDTEGTGPGSMDAWVAACRDEPFWVGAGSLEGLKAVATIEAMYRSALSGKAEAAAGCAGL